MLREYMTNLLPKSISEAIKQIVSTLSEEHRSESSVALAQSWELGGLSVIFKTHGGLQYYAQWRKLPTDYGDVWLGSLLVVIESSRAAASGD